MLEPFIGEIALYPYNFAPKNWAFCWGQLLSIAQNTALFSLLGTTYGGDGVVTFALPDLRGRVPVGYGQGPGLPFHDLGEIGGSENRVLTVQNLPSHSHTISASSEAGNSSSPENAYLANTGALDKEYRSSADTIKTMNTAMVGTTGGNQAFSIMQPYLVLNYCIALQGIFPSRD